MWTDFYFRSGGETLWVYKRETALELIRSGKLNAGTEIFAQLTSGETRMLFGAHPQKELLAEARRRPAATAVGPDKGSQQDGNGSANGQSSGGTQAAPKSQDGGESSAGGGGGNRDRGPTGPAASVEPRSWWRWGDQGTPRRSLLDYLLSFDWIGDAATVARRHKIVTALFLLLTTGAAVATGIASGPAGGAAPQVLDRVAQAGMMSCSLPKHPCPSDHALAVALGTRLRVTRGDAPADMMEVTGGPHDRRFVLTRLLGRTTPPPLDPDEPARPANAATIRAPQQSNNSFGQTSAASAPAASRRPADRRRRAPAPDDRSPPPPAGPDSGTGFSRPVF